MRLAPVQGYNDGLTTLPLDDDYEPRLSPKAAQAAEFDDWELETVRACHDCVPSIRMAWSLRGKWRADPRDNVACHGMHAC